MMLLLLKSHVAGYTRADGTVVQAHDRIQRHQVKPVAEHIAERFRKEGFQADVNHSGSAAGASSYVRVSDPNTGRSFKDEIRVSDHDKGAFNWQFYHHVTVHGDVEAQLSKLIPFAHEMRAQGKSSGVKAEEEREAKAKEIRIKNARKKLSKGKPLSIAETHALQEIGELAKARPTPAQAEAGNYKKPRVKWQGLEIAIENPVGTVRRGKGWETKMQNAYGYICRSGGVDGDEVDVYLGDDLDAPTVYVVHQRKAGDWKAYDEDKCMIGFKSEADAKAAYLKHYDDDRFLGPITAMPVDKFVEKVKATYDKPAMIKAVIFLVRRTGS